VVTADGETWFRARLDLEGCTAVQDIEASVTDLWEDGQKVPLSEYLTLTMYPGILVGGVDANKKTLNEGRPEFVDIIRVANGMAHFPLKIYPRAVAHATLLKPKHTYQIVIAICSSSNNRTDICTFEFEWTGAPVTSDIKLISVTPPPRLPLHGRTSSTCAKGALMANSGGYSNRPPLCERMPDSALFARAERGTKAYSCR
jgi:hypothetical protein